MSRFAEPRSSRPSRTPAGPRPVRPFKLIERKIWPGYQELAIQGELDGAVSEQLRDVLAVIVSGDGHVLIDLGDCDLLDARGLAVLLEARARLKARGRHFLAYRAAGQVLRMLSITGVAASDFVLGDIAEQIDRFEVRLPLDGAHEALAPAGPDAERPVRTSRETGISASWATS
jgi:anti-anti-sigma factor